MIESWQTASLIYHTTSKQKFNEEQNQNDKTVDKKSLKNSLKCESHELSPVDARLSNTTKQ